MKKTTKLSSLTLVSALAASSCCIAPILALLLGSSSLASSFSWLEPAQPFFIACTVLLLAYAWFKKYKSKQQACCTNPTTPTSFFQRTTTLVVLTIISGLLLAFPFYSSVFYPTSRRQINPITTASTQVELQIQGMTCEACSQHITHEVSQLKGVLDVTISYAEQKGKIAFDREQISIQEIEQTIKSIGYQTQIKNN